MQAWKARRVAAETTTLSVEAVGFVDRHLAVTARRNTTASPGKLRELVHEAMLRCDPDRAAGIEQAALDARGVWFDHRTSTATTDVTARLDTLDALDLQASVGDLAGLLGRLGDDRPLRYPAGHRTRPARPPPTRPRPRGQPRHRAAPTSTGHQTAGTPQHRRTAATSQSSRG